MNGTNPCKEEAFCRYYLPSHIVPCLLMDRLPYQPLHVGSTTEMTPLKYKHVRLYIKNYSMLFIFCLKLLAGELESYEHPNLYNNF